MLPDLSGLSMKQEATGVHGTHPYQRPASNSKQAKEDEDAQKTLSMVLRVRRMGEASLRTNPLYGQEYCDFWIQLYKEDRAYQKTLPEYGHADRDIHLKSAPQQRRQVPYTITLSRPPGSDPRAPYPVAEAMRWEYIPGTEVDDNEYANWRRGHEQRFIRQEEIRKKRKINPYYQWTGPLVDRVSPAEPANAGKSWHRFEKMDLYYYVNVMDGCVLRLDKPENFPDPRIAEAARVRTMEELEAKMEAERQAQLEAAKAVAEAEATAKREADEAETARLKQVKDQYVGRAREGNILYDSHAPLALPNNSSDSLYLSIAVLRTLRAEGPPPAPSSAGDSVQWEGLVPLMKYRRTALEWLNYGVTPGQTRGPPTPGADLIDPAIKRTLILDTNDQFKRFLRGEDAVEGFDYRVGTKANYSLGMRRAMRMLNKWRAGQPRAWQEFSAWDGPIEGPPAPLNASLSERVAHAKAQLLGGYVQAQALARAWPTLYDAEALAWQLQTPIYLYSNSGAASIESGAFVQDWNTEVGFLTTLGPVSSVAEPYRLLWSGDQTMRFRPLVDRKESIETSLLPTAERAAQSPAAKGLLEAVRDDRLKTDIRAGYYASDVWNGLHQAVWPKE